MDRDTITQLAREVGLWPAVTDMFPKELERFAALVAEATKERCAQACDGLGATLLDDSEGGGAFTCAEAIRNME